MTPQEFKAWFDGFTEAMNDTPNKEQWARIKKRVAEIDGRPVTERIFIDRWLPHIWPHFTVLPAHPLQPPVWSPPLPIWCGNSNALHDGHSVNCNMVGSVGEFDSLSAMNTLGRAEFSQ